MRHPACAFVLALLLAGTILTNVAAAQAKFAPCKPIEAATFSNRVHVRCESAVDGKFFFFAVSTAADPKFAARALSVIEAGQLGDKFLSILFDPSDTSGDSFGCLAADCRPLLAVSLTEDRPGKCDIDNTQKSCPGFCASVANKDRSCPGFCNSVGNNDASCPGFCSVGNHNTTDSKCPGFCAAGDHNTTSRSCPGYCDAHQADAKCIQDAKDRCDKYPHSPGCGTP
jgi:hypothetical protein